MTIITPRTGLPLLLVHLDNDQSKCIKQNLVQHLIACTYNPASRTKKLAPALLPPPNIRPVATSPTVFLNSAPTFGSLPRSESILASSTW